MHKLFLHKILRMMKFSFFFSFLHQKKQGQSPPVRMPQTPAHPDRQTSPSSVINIIYQTFLAESPVSASLHSNKTA